MGYRNPPTARTLGLTNKISTFSGPASDEPTADGLGDIWYVEQEGNPDIIEAVMRWDGSAWREKSQNKLKTGIAPAKRWELFTGSSANELQGHDGVESFSPARIQSFAAGLGTNALRLFAAIRSATAGVATAIVMTGPNSDGTAGEQIEYFASRGHFFDALISGWGGFHTDTQNYHTDSGDFDTDFGNVLALNGKVDCLDIDVDGSILNMSNTQNPTGGTYTGSALLIRLGNVVFTQFSFNRPTGFNATMHPIGGIQFAVEYRPQTSRLFPSSKQHGAAGDYQFRMNTDGTLDIRESAAISQEMNLHAAYILNG